MEVLVGQKIRILIMANVILVTGGARSGKSAYSETLAKSFNGSRVYIATCPVMDEEMARRVERHQQQRKNDGWTTVEEERDLSGVIRQSVHYDTILVDCLTLWINNLMYYAERAGAAIAAILESVEAEIRDMIGLTEPV